MAARVDASVSRIQTGMQMQQVGSVSWTHRFLCRAHTRACASPDAPTQEPPTLPDTLAPFAPNRAARRSHARLRSLC
jgi:hypothetical protein